MTFVPEGVFSTAYKMTLLVADSVTAQEVLEAADADAAKLKTTTYSEEEFPVPRCIILEQDVRLMSDDTAMQTGTEARTLGVELFFYVPKDNPDIVTIQDEHSYVMHQFGKILNEMLALSGQNGHLAVYDPTLFQPERMEVSERFDEAEVNQSNPRALWFGILTFNVR